MSLDKEAAYHPGPRFCPWRRTANTGIPSRVIRLVRVVRVIRLVRVIMVDRVVRVTY